MTYSRLTKTKKETTRSQTSIIRGALFRHTPTPNEDASKQHPVYDIQLEVMGVKLRLAAWPQVASQSGTVKYMPISGEYARGEVKRLVDVTPVMNAQQGGAASPVPAAPVTAAASVPDDLPF